MRLLPAPVDSLWLLLRVCPARIDVAVPVGFRTPNSGAPIQSRSYWRLHLLHDLIADALKPPRPAGLYSVAGLLLPSLLLSRSRM